MELNMEVNKLETDDMALEVKEKKPYKTFMDYYKDPTYKEKHLKYICTKVQCPECKAVTNRCGMAKHRRSKKHIYKMDSLLKEDIYKQARIDDMHNMFYAFVKVYAGKIHKENETTETQ